MGVRKRARKINRHSENKVITITSLQRTALKAKI
jgi:hypothetical protein